MTNSTTIIGITGNIATGKSVVRRMLANAGAFGLDADVIAHRMIYSQGPAFQAVVSAFGQDILDQNGEIDRSKLGEIVFKDPDQLKKLESIVHPAVTDAIQNRLGQTQPPLAALEAIKLLEAGLGEICDAVWVSHAPRQVQLQRLLKTRGLSDREAQDRLDAQPPQNQKLDRADRVIHTNGPFQRTWEQVWEGLNDTIQEKASGAYTRIPTIRDLPQDELQAFWIEQVGPTDTPDLYETLGMRMVQPLVHQGRLKALVLWDAWNFTATLTRVLPGEFLLTNAAETTEAFKAAAHRQGCELLLLAGTLVRGWGLNPKTLGFSQQNPANLPYPAWRDAAQTLALDGRVWYRILAQPLEADGVYQLK